MAVADEHGRLEAGDLEAFAKRFVAEPAYRRAQNAVTQTTIEDVALDRQRVLAADRTVSHQLDAWRVTHQKKSGRCWLFAGLNLLRPGVMGRLNVEEFEFSQCHTMFWDKLERANYFLEAIIETADRPVDDRTVSYLLSSPLSDGGQWTMFVAVVDKHGLVPKTAMPETESSSNSGRMNASLRSLLRDAARRLREATAPGQRRELKAETLAVVYRMLCIHLGSPPDQFDWQWRDKDKVFHSDGRLTPREFAARYVELPLADYVCLVDDPRPSSPRGRTLTVEYLGNVVGGPPVRYLNVDVATIKELAARTITGGEPVWFGCDVAKMMRRDLGVWDAQLFDLAGTYDVEFGLDKAGRLTFGESEMTHAMLFTGVDLADGHPRRWRVENSWGDEHGADGFYTMNDNWFGEYVFEVAIRADLLPAELRRAAETEPIVLPAWDPMGALAG